MEESATYQALLSERMEKGMAKGMEKGMAIGIAIGRLRYARKLLLHRGSRKLGKPDLATAAMLESLMELIYIEELIERVQDVNSWQELLGTYCEPTLVITTARSG